MVRVDHDIQRRSSDKKKKKKNAARPKIVCTKGVCVVLSKTKF